MLFLTYIQNLTTIDPAVSEITCIITMNRDRQTDGNEKRTEGVMKCRENIKVAIRPMDSITILLYLTLEK